MSEDPPRYRIHRARRGFIAKLLDRGGDDRFSNLEKNKPASRGEGRRRPDPRERDRDPREQPRERKPITPGRVFKWVVLAGLFWVALSAVLFFFSAQIQSGKVSDSTKAALDDSGNLLTSANNILVLGSDRRKAVPGRGRADTIMMMRYGGGKSARLAIPRDTLVDIPGHGRAKINAAFAIGGAPLTIATVKQYLGVEVNHIVEINFKGFPKFVDSIGGVTMSFDTCVRSRFEGRTIRFKKGENHLDGQQALDAVRVRNNRCNPADSDLTRVANQQKFLNAVRSRVKSPLLFPRWPLIGWNAPRAIRSDLGGAGLAALFWDIQTSGSPKPQLLKPEPALSGGGGLVVSDAEKQAKVGQFLEG